MDVSIASSHKGLSGSRASDRSPADFYWPPWLSALWFSMALLTLKATKGRPVRARMPWDLCCYQPPTARGRMIPVKARLLTAKGRLNGGTIMRVAVVFLQCHQEFRPYGGYPSFQNSDCRSASCLDATGSLRLGWRRLQGDFFGFASEIDRGLERAGPAAQCAVMPTPPLPRQRGASPNRSLQFRNFQTRG